MGCSGFQDITVSPTMVMTCYKCGKNINDKPKFEHQDCIEKRHEGTKFEYEVIPVDLEISGYESR